MKIAIRQDEKMQNKGVKTISLRLEKIMSQIVK